MSFPGVGLKIGILLLSLFYDSSLDYLAALYICPMRVLKSIVFILRRLCTVELVEFARVTEAFPELEEVPGIDGRLFSKRDSIAPSQESSLSTLMKYVCHLLSPFIMTRRCLHQKSPINESWLQKHPIGENDEWLNKWEIPTLPHLPCVAINFR